MRMCFFNSMSLKAQQLARKYGRDTDIIEAWKKIMVEGSVEGYASPLAVGMYNIPAYSEPRCVIVSSSRELQVMQWGLIPRTAKPEDAERYNRENWFKNARGEDIFETWPYRMGIAHRRCLIPSTGYFEYHYLDTKTTQPYFIYLPNREVFSMAGIWDRWPIPGKGGTPEGGDDLDHPDFDKYVYSFVQITTAANDLSRTIHNGGKHPYRMPVILRSEDETRWLDPEMTDPRQISALMKPYAGEMSAYPVGKDFNRKNPFDKDVIREAIAQQKLKF